MFAVDNKRGTELSHVNYCRGDDIVRRKSSQRRTQCVQATQAKDLEIGLEAELLRYIRVRSSTSTSSLIVHLATDG